MVKTFETVYTNGALERPIRNILKNLIAMEAFQALFVLFYHTLVGGEIAYNTKYIQTVQREP